MKTSPATVTVEQVWNPRYCEGDPVAVKQMQDRFGPNVDTKNEWLYKVKSTVNTISPKLGTYLTPSAVEVLIGDGVKVNVVPFS